MRRAWTLAAVILALLIFARTGNAESAQPRHSRSVQPGMAVPQKSENPARWSAGKAKAWYAKQPWLVGSNYIPATASNELEMWQAETFDPKRIDLELGWAV